MDDIRRPHHQRRDFAMRHRAHQPAPPQPLEPTAAPAPYAQPEQHQPAADNYQPANTYAQPFESAAGQPFYPADEGFAPAPAGADDYSQPALQARPRPAVKKRRLPKIPLKYAIAGAAAVILIAASAYMLTRPAQKSGFSVAQLSKKSSFGFYYPQALPGGYIYDSKINAFQDGQAYFMLANGSKHLIVHEQAASRGAGLSGLDQPQTINAAIGKAAMGTVAGQPAAKVLAGSTMISINTTGPVPKTDLVRVINSLKTDR